MNTVRPPFFILGNPRSGTSLLRVLVSGHPSLIVPPECGFIVWLEAEFNSFKGDPNTLKRFVEQLILSRKFETWGLQKNVLLSYLSELSPKSYTELVSGVYHLYAQEQQKTTIKRWGDKNNWYVRHGADLKRLFPQASFIHLIRDGRDVACSYLELTKKTTLSKYAPKLSSDLYEIGKEWGDNNDKIAEDLREDNVLRVYYEDVVRQPLDTLNKIFTFLQVSTYAELDNSGHYKNLDEPEDFLAWKEKLRQPISTVSVGRFKTDLSQTNIKSFINGAGDRLQKFGYGQEGKIN